MRVNPVEVTRGGREWGGGIKALTTSLPTSSRIKDKGGEETSGVFVYFDYLSNTDRQGGSHHYLASSFKGICGLKEVEGRSVMSAVYFVIVFPALFCYSGFLALWLVSPLFV